MKDWKLHRDEPEIVPQIKKGGDIWGKPAKDIILKDIIESKVQRIKDLEKFKEQVEELEEKIVELLSTYYKEEEREKMLETTEIKKI